MTPKIKRGERESLIFLKRKEKARTVIHPGDRTRSPSGHITIEWIGTIKHCHILKEKESKGIMIFDGYKKKEHETSDGKYNMWDVCENF